MGKKSRAKQNRAPRQVHIMLMGAATPVGKVYTIGGEDADILLDMMAATLEFVSGPGLPGFAAFMDQMTAGQPCEDGCDGGHRVHSENIRRHTSDAAAKLRRLIADTS